MDRILNRVVGFLRWLFAPEQLPVAAPPAARERGVVARLCASDPLGVSAADRPRRRRPSGFLSAALASETLPRRDAAARDEAARVRLLRRILAPDRLPRVEAPIRDRSARPGFVKWVLSSQELPRRRPEPRPRGRGYVRWLLSRDEL